MAEQKAARVKKEVGDRVMKLICEVISRRKAVSAVVIVRLRRVLSLDERMEIRSVLRTDERTYGRTNGRTNGRIDGRMDGRTKGRTNGRTALVCDNPFKSIRYHHQAVRRAATQRTFCGQSDAKRSFQTDRFNLTDSLPCRYQTITAAI